MKTTLFRFSLILNLFLLLMTESLAIVSASEPVLLSETAQEYPLGFHVEILEDPHKQWTLEDVSSPEFDERFSLSQEAIPNFGFSDSAYWIRFQIQNEVETIPTWLLELSCAAMHSIDIYLAPAEMLSIEPSDVRIMPRSSKSMRAIAFPLFSAGNSSSLFSV